MLPRIPSFFGATVLLILQSSFTRAATLPGSPRGQEAVALCTLAADEPDRAVRARMLERGLALAEAALDTDNADAAAYFGVFCTLGRRLQGRPIGWSTLGTVRRAQHAIDRALGLAPQSPELLTAKGMMLLALPRLLGGDAAEGETLLRRALEIAPGFARAARALAERGVAAPPSGLAAARPEILSR